MDDWHVEGTGMGNGARPEPCAMVIFGASGDLTHRELIPSLYELHVKGLLPEPFAVIGFARSEWSDAEFRERMRKGAEEECVFDADRWEEFASCLSYVRGDFTDDASGAYARLGKRLEKIREEKKIPDHVFFHLAAPPAFFDSIVSRLGASGLARSAEGWRRLVVEKPFGTDEASARELDRAIGEVFPEDRTYRIDHFLGKETVQNMLVYRFANPSFEPIWNRDHIDHVQITVAEDLGIGTRAGFYEKTGVVRDMLQNHLLQLLCMTAIEPPTRFDGSALRDETAKVLSAVHPLDPERCVRGQYGPGRIDGKTVHGYREEKKVADDSDTPTFVAARLEIDNWRWAGVPFYLRTGKRMPRKLTEVSIHFKPTPHLMFRVGREDLTRNVLTFRLQPEEGILQSFAAKRPGPGLAIEQVKSSFLYADAFGIEQAPRAYAWLLLDVMEGDQTLFARSDWIYEAWSIVDPLIETWESDPPGELPDYAAGTWGPAAADALLESEGREWSVI